MNEKPKAHVSEAKKREVKKLVELAEKHNTILIASIKNLPAAQFQSICKELRGTAVVKVPKKRLLFRAIEQSLKDSAKKLEEKIDADIAVLFSDIDGFELSAMLIEKRVPASAKEGQIAPEDIIIQPGPTELTPGPAISELGALGIQIQIKDGKIEITQEKTVVKKGEVIDEKAVSILNKLGMKPISVGFAPLACFDKKSGKVYLNIEIDKEKTLEELKDSAGKAISFALNIGYPTKETIAFLLQKAEREAKSLEKYSEIEKNKNPEESEKTEDNTPEKTGEENK